MSGFAKTTLAVTSSDGRNFTLLEDLVYVSLAGVTHTVPAGSKTDGASTPAYLWAEIPPFGRYWLAAVLHDWAYRYSDLAKQECDWLLKEAMLDLGVGPVMAGVIYEGVHLEGQASFDEDRKARAA